MDEDKAIKPSLEGHVEILAGGGVPACLDTKDIIRQGQGFQHSPSGNGLINTSNIMIVEYIDIEDNKHKAKF